MKENCCLTSVLHFSFKYFSKNAFLEKNVSKIVRLNDDTFNINIFRTALKGMEEFSSLLFDDGSFKANCLKIYPL